MKPPTEQSPAAGPRPPESTAPPAAEQFATPMWLVALTGLLCFWGAVYLDLNAGGFQALVFNRGDRPADVAARVPKSGTGDLVTHGRRIYGVYCAACHQPDGRGRPGQFPPLAGSEWVNAASPDRIIRVVLDGAAGPMTVRGQTFNNAMLLWRAQLSDEDIAAVLTFVRRNAEFHNTAGPVAPAQVKAIRDATQDRRANWTEAELLAVPVSE